MSLDSQIIALACSGYSNKQIAHMLGLSLGYIKNKMSNIYKQQGISGKGKRTKLVVKVRSYE